MQRAQDVEEPAQALPGLLPCRCRWSAPRGGCLKGNLGAQARGSASDSSSENCSLIGSTGAAEARGGVDAGAASAAESRPGDLGPALAHVSTFSPQAEQKASSTAIGSPHAVQNASPEDGGESAGVGGPAIASVGGALAPSCGAIRAECSLTGSWGRHLEDAFLARGDSGLAAEVGFDPSSGLSVEPLARESVASRAVGDLGGDARGLDVLRERQGERHRRAVFCGAVQGRASRRW